MGALHKKEVMRRCVACRKPHDISKLLRFVRSPDGTLVFDVHNKRAGRGAYLCSRTSCFKLAGKKNAFYRAFSAEVIVDSALMQKEISSALEKEALRSLGLAFKWGLCLRGEQALFKENSKPCVCILFANDLSKGSLDAWKGGLQRSGKESSQKVLKGPSQEKISLAVGLKQTGIVGLLKGRITNLIIRDLEQLRSFNEY